MVFFDGEGVPSQAPHRVISPRSGAWVDAGEGYNRSCFPGPAFPGISPALPPPGGGGGARNAGGVDAGEGYNRSCFPGPGLIRGYHLRALPPPEVGERGR